MKQKYLWLAVETDQYELPIAVADTAEELANYFGVKQTTVFNCVMRGRNGRENGYKYIRVIDDGQDV